MQAGGEPGTLAPQAAGRADATLRLGLLVEALDVPRWVRAAIERVAANGHARIAIVVVASPSTGARPPSLYERVDRRLARAVGPDALAPTSLRDLVAGAVVHCAAPVRAAAGDVLPDDATLALRAAELDVVVNLRAGNVAGEVLAAPRCGVWSWRRGTDGFDAAQADDRARVTDVTIERASARRTDVLSRSWIAGDASAARRTNAACWKAAALLPRLVDELWRLGPEAFEARVAEDGAADDAPRGSAGAARSRGSQLTSARLLARAALRRTTNEVRQRLFQEQWLVLYSESTAPVATPSAPPLDLSRFRRLLPPEGRGWADPHLWVRDGEHHLFVEEISRDGLGRIGVTVHRRGRWTAPVPVLAPGHHVSHPFLFEHDGTVYMVPESRQNRTVDLYRCDRFPDRWSHARTLLSDVCAVDATLLRHGGWWWMFANVASGEGASTLDELYLFRASDPVDGRWIPHPRNPVVADVRHARPAGPIFQEGGMLVRPAQDCSTRYGRAVRFMRIDRLDEAHYVESEVSRLEPPSGGPYLGIHSFDRAGTMTVVDAVRLRRRTRLEPATRAAR